MEEGLKCKHCWWLAPERNLNCCAMYYRVVDEYGEVIVSPDQPACELIVPLGTLLAERADVWEAMEQLKAEILKECPWLLRLLNRMTMALVKEGLDNQKG